MITTIMIAAAAGVVGAGLGYGLMRVRVQLALAEAQTALYAKADSAAVANTLRVERDALAVKLNRLTDRDPKTGRFVKREAA